MPTEALSWLWSEAFLVPALAQVLVVVAVVALLLPPLPLVPPLLLLLQALVVTKTSSAHKRLRQNGLLSLTT